MRHPMTGSSGARYRLSDFAGFSSYFAIVAHLIELSIFSKHLNNLDGKAPVIAPFPMEINKKELEKLPPQERIKKLKDMEQRLAEERKKDSQQIETLLKKSMEDLKTDRIAQKVAPPQQQVDITRLFSEEEATIGRKKPGTLEEGPSPTYLRKEQLLEDYSAVKDMLGYELKPGSLREEQVKRIEDISGRINKASYQSLSHSDQVAILVSATREALYRVKKYSGIE